jgi:hypothetical protein
MNSASNLMFVGMGKSGGALSQMVCDVGLQTLCAEACGHTVSEADVLVTSDGCLLNVEAWTREQDELSQHP